MKIPVSACILTHNSIDTLERAVRSVDFCDEILLLDDYSTDKTEELGTSLGAICIKRHLDGDFSAQRMHVLSKAKNEYVLFIDSDEEVSAELQKNITNLFVSDTNKQTCYFIKRRDFFWNTELKHGETQKVRSTGIIRLVKKGTGTFKGSVHEIFESVDNPGAVEGFINHYPHPTVAEFLNDINIYSSIRAKDLYEQNARSHFVSIIMYPSFKFLLTYFFYLGFLDGAAGFAYSFFMSFHSFLVRSKLYQYQRFGFLNK